MEGKFSRRKREGTTMKKFIVLMIVLFAASISLPACGNTAQTSPNTEATQTMEMYMATSQETAVETGLSDASNEAVPRSLDMAPIVPVADVQDEDAGLLQILSWDDALKLQIDTYYVADRPGFTYEYQTVAPGAYEAHLDAMFASAESLPDIVMMNAAFARTYVHNKALIGIDQLGISTDELSGQYAYTYRYMTDDAGAVKGLSWQVHPIGVFYNRDVARQYLGVDDPETVGVFFSSWDNFLPMAQMVNTNSGGTVKAVADMDAAIKGYLFSRTSPWVVDGSVVFDEYANGFLDFYKTLAGEGLTYSEARESDLWYSHAWDHSVLAYFMTAEQFATKLGFGYAEDGIQVAPEANPTTGAWAACPAPTDYFLEGEWLTATKDNDKRATTADLFRYFTIDLTSVGKLAASGTFVNQTSIVDAFGADPVYNSTLLAGQNPYLIFSQPAKDIDMTLFSKRDQAIEDVFFSISKAYVNGVITDRNDVSEIFLTDCEDLALAEK